MAFFNKVLDLLGSGIADKIVKTVTKYFPPKLSEGLNGIRLFVVGRIW